MLALLDLRLGITRKATATYNDEPLSFLHLHWNGVCHLESELFLIVQPCDAKKADPSPCHWCAPSGSKHCRQVLHRQGQGKDGSQKILLVVALFADKDGYTIDLVGICIADLVAPHYHCDNQ